MENTPTTRAHRRIAYAANEIRRHLDAIAEQQASLVKQHHQALPDAALQMLANLSAAHEEIGLELFEIESAMNWHRQSTEVEAENKGDQA